MAIPEEVIQFQRRQEQLVRLRAQQTTQAAIDRVQSQIDASQKEFTTKIEPGLTSQVRKRLESEARVAVTTQREKTEAAEAAKRAVVTRRGRARREEREKRAVPDRAGEARVAGIVKRERRRVIEKGRVLRAKGVADAKARAEQIKLDQERGVGGFKTSKSGVSGENTLKFITDGLVGIATFITKYDQSTLARFSQDMVGTTTEARKDLGNILRGLKGLSNTFKAQGNFPTRAEADAFFKENPGARFDLGAQTPLSPQTVDEWFGRLGFAATEASLGGLIEFTLPMSIGLAPPEDVFDVQMRLVGALVTPSPSDFAITQVASKLARVGKDAKRLLRKLLTGSSLSADEAVQFEKLVGSFGVSTDDLRNARTDLFKDIPLDDIGTSARKADDILSDLAGQADWSGGLDDALVSSPLDQKRIIADINKQISDYRKAFESLTDISPDVKLTNWGLLSTREQQQFLREFKKLDDLFQNNPELFGAGAAYKPASLQEFQDILTDHGVFNNADEYLNFLETYGVGRTFVITPATLTVLLNDLNTTVDEKLNPARVTPTIGDPIVSPGRPDIDIKEILETQDITDPKELIIPVLPDLIEPTIPDIIPAVTPDIIPAVTPDDALEPPQPVQIQEPVLTTPQVATQRPSQKAKEERERVGIPGRPVRRPKVSRRPPVVKKPPKIPSFPKGANFKVRFRTFIGGEIIRVRAKNFREAEIKAERTRKDDADILEVEVTRL